MTQNGLCQKKQHKSFFMYSKLMYGFIPHYIDCITYFITFAERNIKYAQNIMSIIEGHKLIKIQVTKNEEYN
jgi:hypothetical protein